METIVGGLNDKKTFLNHVFSNTEEGKAEILNVLQYSFLAIIPVIILNKCVQKFIPEVDLDKSSLEILAEILLQIIVMFIGIIFINRIITFFPTYSGFKYDNFVFSNVILAFFIIIFSINTKLGIKVNLLIDRFFIFWDGSSTDSDKKSLKKYNNYSSEGVNNHTPSQADFVNTSNNVILPNPMNSNSNSNSNSNYSNNDYFGPIAANSVLPNNFFS